MKKKTIQLTSDIWLAWWGNMTWLTLWRFLKIWKQFDNSEFVYNFEMLWKFWQVAILATLTTLTNFGNFLHFWTILTIVWQLFDDFWQLFENFWQFFSYNFYIMWQFLQFWTNLSILDKLVNFWQFLDNSGQFWTILTSETIERTVLETCDIWDTDCNSDDWEPEFWQSFLPDN